MNRLGIVVIGRNEAERLQRCLGSVLATGAPIVYVDSGSDDHSVEIARRLGVAVEVLDTQAPYTAARARNAGLRHLQSAQPQLEMVQFVDADCELVAGWLELATGYLQAQPRVAVVCGRRRELARDSSVYRRLCDIEWDMPVGEVQACGGDALVNVGAFSAAGGFDAGLAAGEEPELCLRLRQRGWKVVVLAADMTVHDSNMTHFRQWWHRTRRAGFAYASVAALQGAAGERLWWRESASIWFWGGLLPVSIVLSAYLGNSITVLLALLYPALFLRIQRRSRRAGQSSADAALFAAACIVGKLPQLSGQVRYLVRAARARRATSEACDAV